MRLRILDGDGSMTRNFTWSVRRLGFPLLSTVGAASLVFACGSSDAAPEAGQGPPALDAARDDGSPITADGASDLRDGAVDAAQEGGLTFAPAYQVAAGPSWSCTVGSTGSAKCWGSNEFGAIGNGSLSIGSFPPTSVNIGPVRKLATSSRASCAVTAAAGAKCWGEEMLGQPDQGASRIPLDVSGLAPGVTDIGVGTANVCAVTTAGEVKCWGSNSHGVLGTQNNIFAYLPMTVFGVFNAKQVAVGRDFACVVSAGGAVRCWGDNQVSQLGRPALDPDTNLEINITPRLVAGLSTGVAQVVAGAGFACALTTSGAVKCWGKNTYGVLGSGAPSGDVQKVPVAVPGLTQVVHLTTAETHVCALRAGGDVLCWGGNMFGQIGDGTLEDRYTPVAVSSLAGVVDVAAGWFHTCAALADGKVKCWGSNVDNALGFSGLTQSTSPKEVVGL